jgi:alanyl-tRNA synthetase
VSGAIEQFSEKVLQRLYGDQERFALAASRWKRAAIVTQTLAATTAVTGGVVAGAMGRNASIADAAYTQLNTSAHMIEDVLRQTAETYSDSLSRGTLTVESSVDALARERQVCVQVAHGIYRAA